MRRLVFPGAGETGAGAPARLDQFLAEAGELGLSRSQVKRLVDEGEVTVNGEPAKAGRKLRAGDVVELCLRPAAPARAEAQEMPLVVLHEDEHIIVIDKPPGLVVHPAAGHPDRTLVNALLYHCTVLSGMGLSGVGGELRPGIVHRLDKDTSGVLVATKSDVAHQVLAVCFQLMRLEREYLAVVAPPPRAATGAFRTHYGRHPVHRKKFSSRVARGKLAVTHYAVERRFGALAALVRCRLETGRTHQIRVHFADGGTPVLGDPLYGRRPAHVGLAALAAALGRQALHAERLAFAHPVTGAWLDLRSELPADMQALLTGLEGCA